MENDIFISAIFRFAPNPIGFTLQSGAVFIPGVNYPILSVLHAGSNLTRLTVLVYHVVPNSNNNSVEETITEETINSSITNMVNDTNVVENEPNFPSTFEPALIGHQIITASQEIKQFLSRPVKLRTGVLTSSSSGQLHAIELPYEPLKDFMFAEKIRGFLNFRATTVIRLQVNANRFVQGRLILHFLPHADVAGTFPYTRNSDLMLKTQQPNVQLDINTESDATLKIPYRSPYLFYDLKAGVGGVGAVYLSVYVPLLFGSTVENPDYTIWAHFEDVDLSVPTAPSFLFPTQGGFSKSTRRRDAADSEKDSSGMGPLSGSLRVVSSVADRISALPIPLISELAGTTAWASDVARNLATAFGYSNPRTEAPLTKTIDKAFGNMTNCDMGDCSTVLAYSGKNKVAKLVGLGPTDEDEASIAFIAQTSSFIDYYPWNTSDGVDTTLLTFPITESSFRRDSIALVGSTNYYYSNYTPVGFLMDCFEFWRGSIKLVFKFVKTEFHTGRLLVYYEPHPNSTTDATTAKSVYCLRDIVDIREGYEFSFIIPFTSNHAWINKTDTLGTLYVKVINPLRCPPTVNSRINMALEVSAGPDFQVNGPVSRTYVDARIPMVISGAPFVTQMNVPSAATKVELVDPMHMLGNSKTTGFNLAAHEFCNGEAITSVMQLLKSPCFLRLDTNTVALSVRPFRTFSMGFGIDNNPATFGFSTLFGDWYSLITSCYAYNRGSVCMKMISLYSNSTEPYFSHTDLQYIRDNCPARDIATAGYVAPYTEYFALSETTSGVLNNGVNVTIPPYMELHTRLSLFETGNTANYIVKSPPLSEYCSKYAFNGWVNTSGPKKLMRSVSDDFQLGYFIGIPPVFRYSGPSFMSDVTDDKQKQTPTSDVEYKHSHDIKEDEFSPTVPPRFSSLPPSPPFNGVSDSVNNTQCQQNKEGCSPTVSYDEIKEVTHTNKR